MTSLLLREVMLQAMRADDEMRKAIRADLLAVVDRDSASHELYIPFLYFKGYHALQSHRIAHWLWHNNRQSMGLFFQNRISVEFGVDIHPAAKMGQGIMLDHATGLVIGETAVVGNNVSILQSVTLGGTGKQDGDRHPKIGDGVLGDIVRPVIDVQRFLRMRSAGGEGGRLPQIRRFPEEADEDHPHQRDEEGEEGEKTSR